MDEDLNARPLIDDEPEDDQVDLGTLHAQEALAGLIPLYEAVTAPEWAAMAGWLAGKEQEALDRMVSTSSTDDFLRWQARVKLLREIQELPSTLHRDIGYLNQVLEGDREHAD